MFTQAPPAELAVDLLPRSTCRVKVAAVLSDRQGVLGWGWNSAGDGFGQHAEAHCLSRANPRRLSQATLWVAAEGERGRHVTAKPCEECQRLLKRVRTIIYRSKEGIWTQLR